MQPECDLPLPQRRGPAWLASSQHCSGFEVPLSPPFSERVQTAAALAGEYQGGGVLLQEPARFHESMGRRVQGSSREAQACVRESSSPDCSFLFFIVRL